MLWGSAPHGIMARVADVLCDTRMRTVQSLSGQERPGRHGAGWLIAATCAALWSTSVAASEESLEEVVVSARKRVEKAQDVPISLSEISGDELQRRGQVRVQDILRQMPNLSTDIVTPRQASVAIRGIGRNPANDGLESSVGVFLDGVYLGRPGMVIADLVDLERIEVLRGPQGALFGKNATAGVINILSAAPASVATGWFELSAGDHELRELRGAASGPLGGSSLSYRFSGFASERAGLVHDTTRDEWLGGLRRAGARGQLQWQPGASTTLRLIADYGSQDETGPGLLLTDPNMYRLDGSLRATNLVTRGERLGYSPLFGAAELRNDANARQNVFTENAGATLLADWNVGDYRLSSITGWRKFSFLPANDGDYSALDVLPRLGTNVHSRQVSEELRLASPAGGKFQYLAGVQFFGQQVQSDLFAEYGSEASAYLFPGLAASALDGFRVLTWTDPDTRSYSAFGQSYWWPRETLEVAAGLRWTSEQKSASVRQHTEDTAALASGSPATTDPAALQARQRLGSEQQFSVSSNEDFVSGSLSLTWHFHADRNAYVSVARGAKSGGVNAAILPAGADLTIDPEIALGYEAGIKTLWLEERLQFNVALFHTRIEGYQASIRDRVVGASYLANAGEVTSSGAEMQAIYRPLAALTLSGAAGYNDAHYESFRNSACPPELDNQPSCDFTGEPVAGAPPLTFSGNVDYDTQIGDGGWSARASLEYSHADGYRAELARSTWIPARDLLNARVRIGRTGDRGSLTLWVNNLTDEPYYMGKLVAGPANTGVTLAVPGTPRSLGLSLQWRY